MPDRLKIIIGLILFVVLLTFPLWYNVVNGKVDYKPELEILTKGMDGRGECVMETVYMREKHMDLLNEWREDVVRKGVRVHIAPDGRKFNKSLSFTCLDCHSNKANFCDQCHNYMAVQPYCWQCHLTTEDANLQAMNWDDMDETSSEMKSGDVVTQDEGQSHEDIQSAEEEEH